MSNKYTINSNIKTLILDVSENIAKHDNVKLIIELGAQGDTNLNVYLGVEPYPIRSHIFGMADFDIDRDINILAFDIFEMCYNHLPIHLQVADFLEDYGDKMD